MLPAKRTKSESHTVVARSTRWVRAPASGIVTAAVRLGSRVREHDRLALLSDPLGDREEVVTAPS